MTFLNDLATGIGYCVIIACLVRVLLPLAGSWCLQAVADAANGLSELATKLAWLFRNEPKS